MSDVQFRSDMTVELINSMGDDMSIVSAARVSTKGADSIQWVEPETQEGLIRFLMRNRHGSPFEHGSMTFYVEAPIFVFREWHRHRAGWSYNEQSGRYKELAPVFWVPPQGRGIRQVGKPGAYTFEVDPYRAAVTAGDMRDAYEVAYGWYQNFLSNGVAREVARSVLPVGTYSSMYATCNPRSLMHFLSLRTRDERSTYESFPQQEIDDCARLMEREFERLWPITYRAFNEFGRVAP